MVDGLKIPIEVSGGGGAATDAGGEQLKKLLSIALQPCPSANPFQDLGLASDIIFRINAPSIEGEVSLEVERIFDYFETINRARLVSTPEFSRPRPNELQMDITFIDLETSREENLAVVLSGVIGEGGG